MVFKLTALDSFVIKGTELFPWFLRLLVSYITKGMEMQHLCLRLLIQYCQGDGGHCSRSCLKIFRVIPQQFVDLEATTSGVHISIIHSFSHIKCCISKNKIHYDS